MDSSAWNARYLAQPDPWGTTPAATVVAEVGRAVDGGLPVGTAVDLACGDGRHARWLATLGWQVTAVDFSEVAIERARERDSDDGRTGHVDWTVGDALDNALMESTIGLYKTELIDRRSSWTGRAEVERETAEWVRWFNADRLHSSIGYQTPIDYETRYCEQRTTATSSLEVA